MSTEVRWKHCEAVRRIVEGDVMNNPVAPVWPGLYVRCKKNAERRYVDGIYRIEAVLLDANQKWWMQLRGLTKGDSWESCADFDIAPAPTEVAA